MLRMKVIAFFSKIQLGQKIQKCLGGIEKINS